MGFAAFEIILSSDETSPLCSGGNAMLRQVMREIRQQWPALKPDEIEKQAGERPGAEWLFQANADGLIQLALWRETSQRDAIKILLRFAYCNPRRVYKPFCEMTEFLMRRYDMICHILPDLAPEQPGLADEICAPEKVSAALLPSMDYNRRLWQLDAGTEETAILRPGDATAQFMTPLFVLAGG